MPVIETRLWDGPYDWSLVKIDMPPRKCGPCRWVYPADDPNAPASAGDACQLCQGKEVTS